MGNSGAVPPEASFPMRMFMGGVGGGWGGSATLRLRGDSLNIGRASGIYVDIVDSPIDRPDGGSATRRDIQDSMKILHEEPIIRDVRNPVRSPRVIVDCAQLRPSGRDFPESPPSTQNQPYGGPANRRLFRDLLQILPNRPMIHEVRNRAQSQHVRADFAVSRRNGR